jgi:predicted phage terminase large subunit-like protein
MFLSTSADIALYGGAAGGGKTYALLLENIRHYQNKNFGSVIFRRNSTQITNEGGLWDSALTIFPYLSAVPKLSPRLSMTFPSGAKVSFEHLQYDKDVFSWQGAQIPLICFDELTHFTRKQFFYMLSRNRSVCGVKPYIRATTNPDAESWVASFIEWWIDQKTGYPIPERSGIVRYFVIVEDKERWGSSKDELAELYKVDAAICKSFTFIASSVFDNKILLESDPGYLANLNAMNKVEKERLLFGNWKIKPAAGLYFNRNQVQVVPVIPGKVVKWCRAWDLAATIPTPENPSPDATAGVLMGKLDDGRYIVAHVKRVTQAASDVRKLTKNTAETDRATYRNVKIRVPQDPGQAGKEQAQSYVKHLSGHNVKTERMSGDKITRAEPFSAQWQGGNVLVLAGDWNEEYFAELEAFPEGGHDDRVDASSDSFTELQMGTSWGGYT